MYVLYQRISSRCSRILREFLTADERTINTFSNYYLNGAGVATPDPGEAPPLAGFNMKSPLWRRDSGCLYLRFHLFMDFSVVLELHLRSTFTVPPTRTSLSPTSTCFVTFPAVTVYGPSGCVSKFVSPAIGPVVEYGTVKT